LAFLTLAVISGWLASPGEAGMAVESKTASLPSRVLRDENFCLGCHGSAGRRAGAAAVDASRLDESAHRTLTCVDCHRDIDAVSHRLPVKRVDCGACHSEAGAQQLAAAPGRATAGYSHHIALRRRGAKGTPGCTDCHGTHGIPATSGEAAWSWRERLPEACRKCHPRTTADYLEGVHGKALLAGVRDVPTCDTCHPEHKASGRESVQERGVVTTCVSCHEDPGLQQKYAIPGNRLASYMGSYHGAATQLGDSRTANCASCHGNHLILPSTDPRSSVNPANLPKTCGKCHPGAGVHFAEGKIHLQPSLKQDRLLFLVKNGYLLFIAGLMSSFLGYIALDLLSRMKGRIETRRREEERSEPQFQRLSLNQRVQHWVLISSFSALIVTGLPLTAPHSAISRGVITFLGGMGARAIIHRVAALVLVVVVIYHLGYVLLSRTGYREFRQLIPGFQDAKDILQMLRFHFGLSPDRARFGRYNFIEKFEYLAVGWGSVVMIGTGALLWAPQFSLAFLPKWMMDVALIVHSWEAILAFLAIIIWHMYNVHWNPSVFPMSQVWLTGKISRHELEENHPLEYERLLRRQPTPDAAPEEEPERV
jgi:predicted CXXCH cytochrome family protein